MKKLATILFCLFISTVSYAQGFIDVLNGINTILETVNGTQNTNSYEDNNYNSGQQYEYNQTQSDNTNYLSLYQQWEQRAQANYNSLTNLGYQMRNNGQQSGGTGQSMSSSNYTRMKRALREAQNEMRNIRVKAARAGITITQSRWETATVDY